MIVFCHDYNVDEQSSPFDVNENKYKSCKVRYALAFNDEKLKNVYNVILKIAKDNLVWNFIMYALHLILEFM